jgi:phenylpropionate dioxygenase-like ring-hydroxylating dioxygenase large terminal subunit
MDEELVLFRDDQGRAGLLGLHCSHRGADLSYGRLEDGGIRCIYHGWLYDREGRCLEQPGEPAGSTFHERIRHRAYPCQEAAGIVFAYLGPGESPLLPGYEFLQAPPERRLVTKLLHECNYLQGNEGNIDPSHQSFLHRLSEDSSREHGVRQILNTRATSPIIDTEEADFGVRIYAVRSMGPDQNNVRISNFIVPNLCAVAGDRYGYLVQWHVPIDDEHHWRYQLWYRREVPFEPDERGSSEREVLPGYRLARNRSNRYQQDREEMKSRSFAGLGANFSVHDACAIEGEGVILDRTREQLGYGDRAIVAARLMLLQAVRDVQAGREPPHVIRDPAANSFPHLFVRRDLVLPKSAEWRGFWQRPAAEHGETWDLVGQPVT